MNIFLYFYVCFRALIVRLYKVLFNYLLNNTFFLPVKKPCFNFITCF